MRNAIAETIVLICEVAAFALVTGSLVIIAMLFAIVTGNS